jgi:hypothetical protein
VPFFGVPSEADAGEPNYKAGALPSSFLGCFGAAKLLGRRSAFGEAAVKFTRLAKRG